MPSVMVVMLRTGERVSVLQACVLNSGPTVLRCLLHSRHKVNAIFQRLVPEHLCSVLSAARVEGAAAQFSFKTSTTFFLTVTQQRRVCSEPHDMLACEQSHEGQAGGDGPR